MHPQVNNTVIDWFEPWPEQALQSVATVFLKEEDLPEKLRPQIVEHMVTVHQSVRQFSTRFLEELRRHNYVTPKNYLDFISNYKRSLATNRKQIDDMAGRLSGGLSKLVQAATEVDAMQKELSEAKVVVQKATEECNALIEVGGVMSGWVGPWSASGLCAHLHALPWCPVCLLPPALPALLFAVPIVHAHTRARAHTHTPPGHRLLHDRGRGEGRRRHQEGGAAQDRLREHRRCAPPPALVQTHISRSRSG